jgi:hypothetical protein
MIATLFEQVREGKFFTENQLQELEALIPTLGNRDQISFRDNLQYAQKVWKNDSEKSSILSKLEQIFHTLLFSIESS